MTSNRSITAILLIVVGYITLQMVFFGHRWVDDESWYTMPIPSILEHGEFRIPTIPRNDVFWPQPPLLSYLEAAVDATVGLSTHTARIIPLLFGIGLICIAAFVAKRIWGWTAAVGAAFLVSADNLVFLASRIIRPEIIVAFFMMLGLVIIAKQVDNQSLSKRSLFYIFIISSLAIASHPNGLMVPLCIGVFWLFVYVGNIYKRITGFVLIGIMGVLALLPLFAWIAYFDAANNFEIFQNQWLGRYGRNASSSDSTSFSIWGLFVGELQGRYLDFIQFPYRVHIAIACIITLLVGFFTKDRWRRGFTFVIVTQLLFYLFIVNANPSVRYFAITTPLFALIWASYISDLLDSSKFSSKSSKLFAPKILVALSVLVVLGVSQVAGNILYLWRFQDADYNATTDRIEKLLKPNSVVYGSMSFWLGLKEYNLIPYIRMSWEKAADDFDANTVILNDWVMAGNDKDWGKLRKELECYLENNGKILGTVNNSFYGDMTIFTIADQKQHIKTIKICGTS